MALRPDRDLFQGRAQPFTFTVTRRERPAEPSSPAENPVTDAASPQSSPVRRAQATAQRHVTRAITLDPSIYASHSRYSQRQFDEEAAAQGEDAELSEDDDAGHELDLEMDMDGAMAFRILGGDTEGEDDNTYSGKAGNSVSAIGRNLQEMVELLIKARRHTTENETNKEAVIHASDHRVGAGRISDDDMELETIPVDPWASFADACKLFLSGDVGNNTANNACLGLAVDIFCMWREQGRLAQPTSSAHPIWTMTMQKTYRGLGRWVQERQGALSKQDSGLE
ncbi:MAG: hypothetical protein STHCBS139747_007338 [Sporothrix thermara]